MGDIEKFRKDMHDRHNVEMSFEVAKARYLELLNLFWILAQKPPEDATGPIAPPPPPWTIGAPTDFPDPRRRK